MSKSNGDALFSDCISPTKEHKHPSQMNSKQEHTTLFSNVVEVGNDVVSVVGGFESGESHLSLGDVLLGVLQVAIGIKKYNRKEGEGEGEEEGLGGDRGCSGIDGEECDGKK